MNELMIQILNVLGVVFLAISYIIFRDLRGGYWENQKLKGAGISNMETLEVLAVAIAGIVLGIIFPLEKLTAVLTIIVGFIWTIIISQLRFSEKFTKVTSKLGFPLVLILSLSIVLGFQQIDLQKLSSPQVATKEVVKVLPEEIMSYHNLDYEMIDAILKKSNFLPKSFELVKVKKGTVVNCIMDSINYSHALSTDVFGFKLIGNIFLPNCQLSGTNLVYESVRFTTTPFPEEWRGYKLLPYSKLYNIQISSKHLNSKSQKDGLTRLNYLMKNFGKTCIVKVESPIKQIVTSTNEHMLLVDTVGLVRPKGAKAGFKGNPIFE